MASSYPSALTNGERRAHPPIRALIGLSFLWHEPGRTHAPVGGRWMRKKSLDVYDPLTDDDVIALAYPSSVTANRRMLVRRAWGALENLEEHGELRIDARRILPPTGHAMSASRLYSGCYAHYTVSVRLTIL